MHQRHDKRADPGSIGQSPVPAKKFQWKKVIRIEGSNLTAANFKYLLKHVSLPGKSS
jgi:hypothetical protein